MSIEIVQKVDRYSAGCQVIQSKDDFEILRLKAYQAKQKYYNYYLFDSMNIEDLFKMKKKR